MAKRRETIKKSDDDGKVESFSGFSEWRVAESEEVIIGGTWLEEVDEGGSFADFKSCWRLFRGLVV
jgi:hypothetical protein